MSRYSARYRGHSANHSMACRRIRCPPACRRRLPGSWPHFSTNTIRSSRFKQRSEFPISLRRLALWRSLKYECVYLHAWSGGGEARAGIGRWIEFYNNRRPHTALGGRTPAAAYWLGTKAEQPDWQSKSAAKTDVKSVQGLGSSSDCQCMNCLWFTSPPVVDLAVTNSLCRTLILGSRRDTRTFAAGRMAGGKRSWLSVLRQCRSER
jgi:hypothetical protein